MPNEVWHWSLLTISDTRRLLKGRRRAINAREEADIGLCELEQRATAVSVRNHAPRRTLEVRVSRF